MAGSNGHFIKAVKAVGLVSNFAPEQPFELHASLSAIGHVRYSTAGASIIANVQPMLIECKYGELAICHNGNFTNAELLRARLIAAGAILRTTSDTEVFLHLVAQSNEPTLDEAITEAALKLQGAFSILLLTKDRLFAIRDPNGFRPLSIGRLGDAYVFASETCAFDLIGAEFWRDVEPGEIVAVGNSNIVSTKPFPSAQISQCIFEYVYFARPDSRVFGQSVDEVRTNLGRLLALESPVDADVVVPIPDSGVCAASGYAEEARIPLRFGLIRNHYVGRTFIQPQQKIRDFGVKLKHNAVRSLLDGRRVVLVDDSLVRGTTSRKIVRMVREAGAREVHLRISCPPTISPCYYGIDTPDQSKLIAAALSQEQVRDFVGADSLGYLSLKGLRTAVGSGNGNYCTSCYTGNYPVAMPPGAIPLQPRIS